MGIFKKILKLDKHYVVGRASEILSTKKEVLELINKKYAIAEELIKNPDAENVKDLLGEHNNITKQIVERVTRQT